MDPQEIDRLLSATLADKRLSGGEKSALVASLSLTDLDDAKRAFIRHRAFALARSEFNSPQAIAVLEWVEDVVKLLTPHSPTTSDVESEACFSPDDDCVARIASLLKRLRQRADICVFTITDDRIAEPLLDAHRRGVQIRILSDDEKSHDPGSDVFRLQRAGVPLRMDRSPYHMHHKFAILDGVSLLTGSYNWTRGAAINNKENILLTTDARLVGLYSRTFERLWQEFA